MYKTNLRDIRFPTENAPMILQKGLINKEDFTHSDANVTLYNTPYAIAKRIFVWTDIEVLLNEWVSVGNSDYNALEKAYSDSESNTDNTDVKWTEYTEPIYIQSYVTPQPKCFTEINEYMNNAESSVSEPNTESVEESDNEQVEEEVVPEEEETEAPTEVEQQQEDVVEESAPEAEEVVDEDPATEDVVEETVSEEEQNVEEEPVAVPVTPVQQNNNQNYTRINNKRNKHNRR